MYTRTPKIGIGITTRNRSEIYSETLKAWKALAPKNAAIVVVDDASSPPVKRSGGETAVFQFSENVGVARAKNKALELLEREGCEHIFLADDDTWPVTADWWQSYVDSPEPHLMYQPVRLPSHWSIKEQAREDGLVSYDKPRGCLLYIHAPTVLPAVGGMSYAFGKHGAEHGNWSDRIHALGLTKFKYADVEGSPRFHCKDEDEAGLSTVDCTVNNDWRHVDAAKVPAYCEYRTTPIPVLVPRRNDHGHRDRLWRYLQASYWSQLPDFKVFEGHHVEGPFNRSLAVNLAADLAGNWDVAIIADSDAFVPQRALEEAVSLARESNRLISCLTDVRELSREATLSVLSSPLVAAPVWAGAVEKVRTNPLETQSLMIAVPRNLWEQVGGFDQEFVGWGGEDNDFWNRCSAATGAPLRLDSPAFHLWHPPASRAHQARNIKRLARR